MYELEPLSALEIAQWDNLIAPYPCRELFHREAWLQYLAMSRGVSIRRWAIRDKGRTIGYFPAGVFKKGPYLILGSPLRGWGSGVMGPVVGDGFDPERFLGALDDLAGRERIAMLEIESSVLCDEHMQRFDYDFSSNQTYIVELTPEDPELMWRRIQPSTRNVIRRAPKNGLTVEDSDDPDIVRELYDGWTEIAARRSNRPPPYDFRTVKLMFEHLKPRDMLFALRVRNSEGIPVATGFFPHDDRTAYFSLTGNHKAYFKLNPNDVLQWTLMSMAAARGIRKYDMYGFGHFKSKFGGQLCWKKRWHRFYAESAKLARWSYERYFEVGQWIRGLWGPAKGPTVRT